MWFMSMSIDDRGEVLFRFECFVVVRFLLGVIDFGSFSIAFSSCCDCED